MSGNYLRIGAVDPSTIPRADGSIPLFDDIKPNIPLDPEAHTSAPPPLMLFLFALLGGFVIWKGMR